MIQFVKSLRKFSDNCHKMRDFQRALEFIIFAWFREKILNMNNSKTELDYETLFQVKYFK